MIGKYTCKVQVPDTVRDTNLEKALMRHYGTLPNAVFTGAIREFVIDIPVEEISNSMQSLEDTTKFLQEAIRKIYGEGSMLFSYSFIPFNLTV